MMKGHFNDKLVNHTENCQNLTANEPGLIAIMLDMA